MTKMTASEVIAEIEWLLECGVSPLYIPTALERSSHALYKLCWRQGRTDLSNLFAQRSYKVAA